MIFCPLIKEQCKGNECVMWKDEKCLLVNTLQNYIAEKEELRNIHIEERIEEVPEEIAEATPEELAEQLVQYIKKESLGDLGNLHSIFRMFFQSKGVSEFMIEPEIQLKIQRAKLLAERQMLENEKGELPSLVSQCADWAITHGLKRVTLADVDAFLIEKNLDILGETRRSLYSLVNVQLRSKC